MPGCFRIARRARALALLLPFLVAAGAQDGSPSHPKTEKLQYGIEWRLINAGTARLNITPGEAQVHLESAGLVSKLYKLDDNYTVQLADAFCATSTVLKAQEGKKHRDTRVTYDRVKKRASYLERDLIKNTTVLSKDMDVPACVTDVIGGLLKLRTMHLAPGQNVQIPTSDGKKWANVRIEAQEKEEVETHLGKFKTVRYEAYLFNGIIYKRTARMFVWLTDDSRELPVQIRAHMSFPIGNITLQLEKEEHS